LEPAAQQVDEADGIGILVGFLSPSVAAYLNRYAAQVIGEGNTLRLSIGKY
jgi:hypothetical protein